MLIHVILTRVDVEEALLVLPEINDDPSGAISGGVRCPGLSVSFGGACPGFRGHTRCLTSLHLHVHRHFSPKYMHVE